MAVAKRFIMYTTRFFAVIGLFVALSAVWMYCLRESTLSIWWHLTRGNQIAYQGRTMTLPLMWRVDQSQVFRGIRLERAYIGSWFTDSLGILSPSPDKAGVLDDASALGWQAELGARHAHNQSTHESSEVLYAKSMNFYCVADEVGSSCKAAGTDWLILFGGRPQSQREARGILKSMQ